MIIELDTRSKVIAMGYDPEEDGSVYDAIITAPYAHPIWRDYWLHISHLRPIIRDGEMLPTKIYLEGATHELWLYALDPDFTAQQHADRPSAPRFLTPMNFGVQLIRDNDEAVIAEMRALAKDIELGYMNPDTDNFRAWRVRFGDNMVKEHYR